MTAFSLFSYAWDIEEIGAETFAREAQALGLTGITLAGSYHAGKFLRPHGREGKIYFPQDGVLYFRHRPERYGTIKPVGWSKLDAFEPFEALARAAPGLERTAWMVCCHNSRIGQLYPEVTARNCFGDPYIYSLNPAHGAVREYVVAMARDIAERHELAALTLETPGWLPYAHGYHHEFAMRVIDPWLAVNLGLCFAPESLEGANKAGIDAQALRLKTRNAIESHLARGLVLDDARAAEWLRADLIGNEELVAFHRWRQSVVTSLVAEIREALPRETALRVIPSVRRPTAQCFLEGSDLAALSEVCDGIEICAYEPDANAVALDAFDVRRRIGEKPLFAVIRPSFPDLGGGAETVAAARHLKEAGVEGLAFYNYGHLDRASLARIPQAIEVFHS